MINIKHINQITKFSDSNYAYLYIPTFELWYEMYKQIIKSDRIADENRKAWHEDWEIGENYIRNEFDRRKRNGYSIIAIRSDMWGILKFSITITPPENCVKYQLVMNEYEVELV